MCQRSQFNNKGPTEGGKKNILLPQSHLHDMSVQTRLNTFLTPN